MEEREKEKESGTIIAQPTRRHLRAGEHRFEVVTFYIPVTCRYCSEFVWTLSRGVECKDCHYIAHLECAPEVPKECAVRLRRTRSNSSPLMQDSPHMKRAASAPLFNRHNILKEGRLLKMGLSDGSWNPVWVILKGEAMYIFRPQQHEIQYTTPLATLSLADQNFSVSRISKLRPNSFVVYIQDGAYYFAALTEQDLTEWLKALKQRKKQLRTKVVQPKAEELEITPHEMAQSFMFMSYISHPEEFAWEDAPIYEHKFLKLHSVLNVQPPKSFAAELKISNLELVGKDEIQYFRAKVPRVIKAQEVETRVRLINAELTDTPVPATFPTHFLALIRFGGRKYRIKCKPDRALYQVIGEDLLMKLKPMDMSCSWAMPSVEDYVVKVGSMNEYIFDTHVKLSSICYVRDCINRSKNIEFEVIEYAPLSAKAANRRNIVPDRSLKTSFCTVEADEELGMETQTIPCYDIGDITKNFELRISGVENFSKSVLYQTNKFRSSDIEGNRINLFVVCGLYYGGEPIGQPMSTQPVTGEPVWGEWLKSEIIQLNDIPREARICFTFYAFASEGGGALAKLAKFFGGGFTEFVPLGWVNFNWVDFMGIVKTGKHLLHMWPSTSARQNPLATCVPNFDPKSLALVVDLGEHPRPVIFGDLKQNDAHLPYETKPPTQNELAQLTRIAKKDALCSMTGAEKKLVWAHRYFLKKNMPNSLSKVLLSTAWHIRAYVKEVHRMLEDWEPVHVIYALELLDVRFPDASVRRFGVRCLHGLSDRELVEYLPQLTQVLKSEPYHYSPLSEFLILRAIHSVVVAHPLFWHLVAEIHVPNISCRFKLMVEAILHGMGDDDLAKEFKKEMHVVKELARIALAVKEVPSATDRKEALKSKLQQFRLPESFTLPNNQKFEATRILIDKCRVMDSFTKPLWLEFANDSAQATQVIFKAGDDLRTDILALQMIRIMDGLWKAEGLDLHMQPYRAVSTGDGLGIIEVITDSQTTAAIQQTFGGGGAISAFSTTALRDWLRACNPTEKAHQEAINNFTLSCAGYCVATYLLGVGDRHNDNIMCSYAGNMFHIDFGYFLGQKVTFAGIPRETTPFVLTPEFAEAMGGQNSENFRRFVQHCCAAYNIIRKHGHLFITLFVMMLSSGIEQLKELEDLYYLRDALSLELTEEEAAKKFIQLIDESLHNQITQLNNMVHIHFHPKNG